MSRDIYLPIEKEQSGGVLVSEKKSERSRKHHSFKKCFNLNFFTSTCQIIDIRKGWWAALNTAC